MHTKRNSEVKWPSQSYCVLMTSYFALNFSVLKFLKIFYKFIYGQMKTRALERINRWFAAQRYYVHKTCLRENRKDTKL